MYVCWAVMSFELQHAMDGTNAKLTKSMISFCVSPLEWELFAIPCNPSIIEEYISFV